MSKGLRKLTQPINIISTFMLIGNLTDESPDAIDLDGALLPRRGAPPRPPQRPDHLVGRVAEPGRELGRRLELGRLPWE